MQYMGGKSMIARSLVAAILSDTGLRDVWFEPFVGGANVMEQAAPHFRVSVGADAHPDLISMWRAVTEESWSPPGELTKGEYLGLRGAAVSPLRGFAGFGCSFGGKWFGGWAGDHDRSGTRDPLLKVSIREVSRQGLVFRTADTRFRESLFGGLTPPDGSVVYCDPPYRGTTGYETGALDQTEFYATLRQWSGRGCAVYVSEYREPMGVPFREVWSRQKRKVLEASQNREVVTERLFRIGHTSAEGSTE